MRPVGLGTSKHADPITSPPTSFPIQMDALHASSAQHVLPFWVVISIARRVERVLESPAVKHQKFVVVCLVNTDVPFVEVSLSIKVPGVLVDLFNRHSFKRN